MNSLVRNINQAVEKSVSESITVLFEKICNKYDTIELAELEKIWNDENGSIKVKVQAKPSIKQEKSTKKVDENKTDAGVCPYVFSKGEKAGNICGSKPKNGNEYCSKHKKSAENVDEKNVKKSEPKKVNSISEKSSTTKKKSPATKKPLERIIKHNKDIDKYWNAETQLVFKSKDDRVVYASFREDELKELTDDDILLCEQYGFKFDNKFPIDEEKDDVEEEVVAEKVIKKKDDEKTKKSVEKESINKKILSSAITENNLKAKSIEDVLNELQLDDDDDDEFIEEEFEEELEE